MKVKERVSVLESQVADIEQQLLLFSNIDPDLANHMLAFWLVTFISSHAAGRIVRWLSKA